MIFDEKTIDREKKEELAWKQVSVVMAGSFGLAVVCCGGAFALDGSRNATLSSISLVLGTVGLMALVVFGVTIVGALLAGVIFKLIRR